MRQPPGARLSFFGIADLPCFVNLLVREAYVGGTRQANFRLGSLVAAMLPNLTPLLRGKIGAET